VAVHPLGPRLEHLPVRHRPVHQGVLAPPCRSPLLLLVVMPPFSAGSSGHS
jgi:hypothetical protein